MLRELDFIENDWEALFLGPGEHDRDFQTFPARIEGMVQKETGSRGRAE
jgi:hypothetical protein